jgi:hypothetical protein
MHDSRQFIQALHHFSTSVNGVLASTFLLYGVGLGSTEAAATAGAINWVLKDGLGQVRCCKDSRNWAWADK